MTPKSLLYLLAWQVKLATYEQAASILKRSVDATRKLAYRLEREGKVQLNTVMAYPLPKLSGPLFTWRPGRRVTDQEIEAVVSLLKNRFAGKRLIPTRVIQATERGAATVGGCTKTVRLAEVPHDLLLPQAMTVMARAEELIGEAVLKRDMGFAGELVDALRGNVAVEIGGTSYRADDIRALMDWCTAARYGLEIW